MCVGEGEYMCRMSACIYSTCTHHSPIASVVKEYTYTQCLAHFHAQCQSSILISAIDMRLSEIKTFSEEDHI